MNQKQNVLLIIIVVLAVLILAAALFSISQPQGGDTTGFKDVCIKTAQTYLPELDTNSLECEIHGSGGHVIFTFYKPDKSFVKIDMSSEQVQYFNAAGEPAEPLNPN